MRLSRGISNVFEAFTILHFKTAGGMNELFNCEGYPEISVAPTAKNVIGGVTFNDVIGAREYISYQGGTGGEGRCGILNIPKFRPLIEYTTDYRIVDQFGKLGVIDIDIEDKYACPDVVTGSESGVFCVANAPVNTIQFVFSIDALNSLKDDKQIKIRTWINLLIQVLSYENVNLSRNQIPFEWIRHA